MWSPYRGLIHYTYARTRRKSDRRISNERVREAAEKSATILLSRSARAAVIDESYRWEDPTEGRMLSPQATKFSANLVNFLHRKDHQSRRALEKLLLAYYSAGYGMIEAVEAAHRDYEAIGEWVLQISVRDALTFSQFFWDWRLMGVNTALQAEYARRVLEDEDRATYFGIRTIQDVRIEVGVAPVQDLADLTYRVASLMGVCAERELKRLIDEGNVLHNPGAFGSMSGFVSAMQATAKSASEMGDTSGASESLQQYMDDKYDDVDPDVTDYSQQEGMIHVTYQDLMDNNAARDALVTAGVYQDPNHDLGPDAI
jgi:hypothetical protein